ncbi:GIY-YIG nuclease family protein [Methylorubrum rhodesianum]|uniref:GIY-YIG nuclease family protein n=1 Tax=Methylorubrum rhodesianum TaxID=29427 RepID=A0ABU9ZD30_9HYPH
MTMRLYFADDGFGSIKIGISADVHRRLAGLGVASPRSLNLIGDVAGDRSQERQVHNALADYRISGEWFRDCDVVRELISRVLAAGLVASGFSPRADEPEGHFTVEEARQLADIIIRSSGVRVTEPGETFGVPNTLLWRMRYRPGRRIFADEWHVLAQGAVRASTHASEAASRDRSLAEDMIRRRGRTFTRAASASRRTAAPDLTELPLFGAMEPRP